jgi:acetyltransferase
LATPEAVRDAFDLILVRSRRRAPEAQLEGIYVEQMASPGREVIIGMTRDPRFGPMLMFGLGGVFVEVLKDVAFHLAPITAAEARQMLVGTRSYALLAGRNRIHGGRGGDGGVGGPGDGGVGAGRGGGSRVAIGNGGERDELGAAGSEAGASTTAPADLDLEAVVACLQRVSQLATDFPEIAELDINPLIVGPPGTVPVVADARIVFGAGEEDR